MTTATKEIDDYKVIRELYDSGKTNEALEMAKEKGIVLVPTRTPHAGQVEFIESKAKRKIIRAGRRGGKTVGAAIDDIEDFLEGRRVLYTAPTGEQTDAYWYEVTRALRPLVETKAYKLNETERYIERVGTKNRIKAKTAWNANTLRGDYADKLTFDEWQLTAEDAWDDVGAPMLLDNNGDAVFIYTPPSLKSSGISRARDPRHATKMFKKAQADTSVFLIDGIEHKRWETFHFTSHDNPHLSLDALAEITQDMSRDSWLKEIMAEDDESLVNLLVYGCFNERICKKDRFEIPKEWMLYSGHDFGCVDDETEILTKRGWKKHDSVIDGEIVLTLNQDTGQSEWQPIVAMNRYNGIFDMRLIEQRSHSSFTTTNHRWLVEKRSGRKVFSTTESLRDNDKITCGSQCSNLPIEPLYTDSFVELVGWFWTEGQIDAGGVSIWQSEGEKAEQIKRCLLAEFGEPLTNTRNGRERAEAGWLERPKRRREEDYKISCHFAINLNGAERLVKVAPHRIVKPEFITSLTASQLKLFIETSIKGDGWKRKGRGGKEAGQSINQSKSIRLDPFQMACSLLGIRTTLAPSSNGRSLLSLHKRTRLHLGQVSQRHIIYNGIVWCPTTPNGTWLARRKGTVYYTGNSANPAALFAAQNPAGDVFLWGEYAPVVGKSTFQNIEAFKSITEGRTILARVGGSHQEDASREDYTLQGWPIAEPFISGQGSVKVQIDRVKGKMEKNKIYIFSDLYETLGQINSCMWKLDEMGKPTNEIKDEKRFHLLACLRYLCTLFNPETVFGSVEVKAVSNH